MAAAPPRDKYFGVRLIFLMLGLGTLLPWNFFMTATMFLRWYDITSCRRSSLYDGMTSLPVAVLVSTMYFTSRLQDSSLVDSSANQTEPSEDRRSPLETKFNNVMTLCAMVPLLLFTCINSFLHSRVPQGVRVMGSLIVILLVFIATAVLVRIPLDPLPFFSVTMAMIVVINSFGAVLQGSLFGMAAFLPSSYTSVIMSGQGLAGTFAAVSMILAIASGSDLQDSAFGYFITACVVIFLSILSYTVLPKLEFYRFHQQTSRRQEHEENSVRLMNTESSGESADQTLQNVSMMTIFKKIWVLALLLWLTFTVTIGTFPAVTADTKTTLTAGGWDQFFIPVSCFLLFNLCDWTGRSLTAVWMWPNKDSLILPALIVGRLVFIPLFMLCNVHPRLHLPVFFHHDAWFIFFMVLFAFSNGYLASLCMCFGPKNVLPHEKETAGTIMAFFLSLGLASGAALSFVFRALV